MTFVAAIGLVLTILGLMGWSAFGLPAHFVGIGLLIIATIWFIYRYFSHYKDL